MADEFPKRLTPYIRMTCLNERLLVARGPFKLVGPAEAIVESDLMLRWIPDLAVEFDGLADGARVDAQGEWSLVGNEFTVPVVLTSTTVHPARTSVRGQTNAPFLIGGGPVESLEFTLVNFPTFIGDVVSDDEHGSWSRARLHVTCDQGECQVDEIADTKDLSEQARREGGFVTTHVGVWKPASGRLSVEDADDVLHMLRLWFGFLRGAWAGPVFPRGIAGGEVTWSQISPWRLSESRPVSTWFPQRRPLALSKLFAGFVQCWKDPKWKQPLVSATSWLVEANARSTALESRIILSQVALDLLAWVELVETKGLHSRIDFKRLSAAGRIRILLHHLGIPAGIPGHYTHVPSLRRDDAFDGPGIITAVRNALVHEGEDKKGKTLSLDGMHLYECGQLALQYLELALLAICHHDGHYAVRRWHGWKGDDEFLVPWRAN